MLRVPSFPLIANIWRNGLPSTDPPSVVSPCNLSQGKRTMVTTGIPGTPATDTVTTLLLLPKLTDVRDGAASGGPDWVEVPAGSGRVYNVRQVDDTGKGFSNEFRWAVIAKFGPWPVPIP